MSDFSTQRFSNTDPREQVQFAPSAKQKQPLNWFWLTIITAILVVVIGGVVFTVKDLQQQGSTEVRSFEVQQNPTIKLINYAGDVQIKTWSSNTVQVRATKQTFGVFQNEAEVKYTKSDNTLEVRIAENALPVLGSGEVDIELTLPAQASIKVETKRGNVALSGSNGQVDLRTTHGSVMLENISLIQPSHLQTVGGTITLKKVTGQLVANTSAGAISVHASTLSNNSLLHTNGGNVRLDQTNLTGKVQASSHTGSIFYQGSLEQTGDYGFKTQAGRIDLLLPHIGSYRFETSTNSGKVTNEFENASITNKPQTVVHASTHAGLIHIKKA